MWFSLLLLAIVYSFFVYAKYQKVLPVLLKKEGFKPTPLNIFLAIVTHTLLVWGVLGLLWWAIKIILNTFGVVV